MMGGERQKNHCPEVVNHRRSIITLYQNISQNSQENTFTSVSFLKKFAHCGRTTLLKETPVQVFPNEFCKVYQIIFFREQVRMASWTV